MRVLFATTVHPEGMRTGSEIVTSAFIAAIVAAGHEVEVLGHRRPTDPPPATAVARDLGVRHIETADTPSPVKAAWMAEAIRRRLPYSAAKYRSRRYLGEVRAGLRRGADVLVVDHAQLGWLVDELDPSQPLVYVAHNVEHHVYATQREASGGRVGRWVHGREARLVRDLEERLARRATQVWALTAEDAAELAAVAGERVRHFEVPGLEAGSPPEVPRHADVAVLGTWTWEPNAEGLRWFCDEVVPLLPAATSVHVGGAGAEWISTVPGVTYHGRVPDAAAFLAGARVVAIPATAGAGVQVKTLDAIAAGAWLVATPTALRGIDAGPEVVRVAEDPVEFAAAVGDLVADPRTTRPNEAARAWMAPRRRRFEADVARAMVACRREVVASRGGR